MVDTELVLLTDGWPMVDTEEVWVEQWLIHRKCYLINGGYWGSVTWRMGDNEEVLMDHWLKLRWCDLTNDWNWGSVTCPRDDTVDVTWPMVDTKAVLLDQWLNQRQCDLTKVWYWRIVTLSIWKTSRFWRGKKWFVGIYIYIFFLRFILSFEHFTGIFLSFMYMIYIYIFSLFKKKKYSILFFCLISKLLLCY